MTFHRPHFMSEAARLVREGRLGEATDTLQRLLRGTPAPQSEPAQPGQAPPVIDIDPATGEVLPPTADHIRGPKGAQFLARTYSSAAGSRGYKLFIPSATTTAAMPLVVMLHGCTQSPDDFAAGTRMNRLAEAHGFLVAYPGQTKSANAHKCWNWFNPADQRRGQGEPALIAGITRAIMAQHAVDPRRVYVAGLSAGGAAASVMGAAYPDLYAAIGVHSGLPCGAARDVSSAFAAMRNGGAPTPPNGRTQAVPTVIFHADKDTTVHPRNAEHIIAQSAHGTGAPPTITTGQVPGGRAYTRSVHADPDGRPMLEHWLIHGGSHAWSGGDPAGTYTDPLGPDASREMLRFFLSHRLG